MHLNTLFSGHIVPFLQCRFRTPQISLKHGKNPPPFVGCISSSFTSSNSGIGPSWSAPEIADAIDGELVAWGPRGTISIDTRYLQPGQWFFALVGQNFDGHDFVNSALHDKRCVGVIGNRVCQNWRRGFIRVEWDTLIALKNMAKFARKRFHGCVVGLTGSVGKTTTRTMVALALENLGQVHQTHGNQNNQIGVPLTLIGIPSGARVSILELGMNQKGELLELARICNPSVRVILNVGPSHMENFVSLEAVARAKGELLAEAKPGDICVLNADDPMVMKIPVPEGVEKVLFGRRAGCDVQLVSAENTDGGYAVQVILERQISNYYREDLSAGEPTVERVEFKIDSPGLHLALNACAAAAVAVSVGVSFSQVGESLSKFRAVHMRSEVEVAQNGIKIVNDTYNANPPSTVAALNLLKSLDCKGRRVVILGDMLELGPGEAEAHMEVLNSCCCNPYFRLILLVGYRFLKALEDLNLMKTVDIWWVSHSEAASAKVVKWLNAEDVVLVKGSRGMQMEKVVNAIKAMEG